MSSGTTITILPSLLLLVHIPLDNLNDHLAAVLECWWFRDKRDPFYALCVNEVELSIFCDRKIARRVFGGKNGGKGKGGEEQKNRGRTGKVEETGGKDGSGAEKEKEKEKQKVVGPLDGIIVGEETWVVLEIEFLHGLGWENSGQRVKELARPLAEEGISILFVSTYISDFILVTYSRLSDVTRILETSGFQFSSPSDDEGGSTPAYNFHRTQLEEETGTEDLKLKRGSSSSGSTLDLEERRFSTDTGRGGSMSGSFVSGGGESRAASLSLSRKSSQSNRAVATGYRPQAMEPLATSSVPSPSPAAKSFSGISQSIPPSPTKLPPSLPSTSTDPVRPILPLLTQLTIDTSTPSHDPSLLPTTASPLPSPIISSHSDSLTILPDELVTVGLNMNPHDPEKLHAKLLQLIFFPHKLLPRPTPSPSTSVFLSKSKSKSRSTPTSTFTSEADYPTPFVAFTQTNDGTSLTADIRLLRAVFNKEEELEFVHTVGQGGLRGLWDGEEGNEDQERSEDDVDEEEEESGRTILKCLQLDLVRFGLDKHGIVDRLTTLLSEAGINLSYQSTYQSANILVEKKDIIRASQILTAEGQLLA